jgi:hypothetical protein
MNMNLNAALKLGIGHKKFDIAPVLGVPGYGQ